MTNAFLGVDLSDEERHALNAALTDASPGPPLPGRRPRPENWHITLRFLGQVDDAVGDRLVAELDGKLDIAGGKVVCSGLGAFPRPSKASVVYAAIVDRTRMLERLAGVCEEAAREVGLPPEGRPFVAHLTLSRLRPPSDVRGILGRFDSFAVPISVGAITLFRTQPGRDGITYRRIESLPLVGR